MPRCKVKSLVSHLVQEGEELLLEGDDVPVLVASEEVFLSVFEELSSTFVADKLQAVEDRGEFVAGEVVQVSSISYLFELCTTLRAF